MPERAGVSLPWPPGKTAPVELCTCCGEPLAAGTDVCPRCNTDVRGGARSQSARASLFFGLFGLAVLPIVFSIPAILLALKARREIARTPGLHGSDAAGWGLATGIMGTVLGILLILTVVLGFAFPT
jgi:predicted nucleic acid-binding Zn ribbon protein